MVHKYQRWDLNKRICFLSSLSLYASSQASYLINLDCYNKLPEPGWLKQQTYLFQFWRLGSPKLRGQQMWFLVKTLFLVCTWSSSPYVFTGWKTETEASFLLSPLIKALILLCILYAHDLITSQRSHLQIQSQRGLGFQYMTFGGHTNMQSITLVKGLP